MDSETVICTSDQDELKGSVGVETISDGPVGAKRYHIWEDGQ